MVNEAGPGFALPEGFLMGASTSAHQVEGNNVSSDWWTLENHPESFVQEPSGDAADSFHRWPEDMDLLRELGFDAYRFSIEWARVGRRAAGFRALPSPTTGPWCAARWSAG